LLGDAGTSEKIGKHRKLVAIATGIKEDELDQMSGELLESLDANQGHAVSDGPQTPPHVMAALEVA
jgi:transcription factor MBP1